MREDGPARPIEDAGAPNGRGHRSLGEGVEEQRLDQAAGRRGVRGGQPRALRDDRVADADGGRGVGQGVPDRAPDNSAAASVGQVVEGGRRRPTARATRARPRRRRARRARALLYLTPVRTSNFTLKDPPIHRRGDGRCGSAIQYGDRCRLRDITACHHLSGIRKSSFHSSLLATPSPERVVGEEQPHAPAMHFWQLTGPVI